MALGPQPCQASKDPPPPRWPSAQATSATTTASTPAPSAWVARRWHAVSQPSARIPWQCTASLQCLCPRTAACLPTASQRRKQRVGWLSLVAHPGRIWWRDPTACALHCRCSWSFSVRYMDLLLQPPAPGAAPTGATAPRATSPRSPAAATTSTGPAWTAGEASMPSPAAFLACAAQHALDLARAPQQQLANSL